MDRRQRMAMQRALVREGIGKLRAAIELFGIEDGAESGRYEWQDFAAEVDMFEQYAFNESPIS